jgi:ABC-type polysaccharide/polyol phosphate export permease
MYLVSGVFFSYERFPEIVQPIIKALPLTAVIDGLRAIINDGAGFDATLRPLITLSFWTILCGFLAMRLFRWK